MDFLLLCSKHVKNRNMTYCKQPDWYIRSGINTNPNTLLRIYQNDNRFVPNFSLYRGVFVNSPRYFSVVISLPYPYNIIQAKKTLRYKHWHTKRDKNTHTYTVTHTNTRTIIRMRATTYSHKSWCHSLYWLALGSRCFCYATSRALH